MRRGGVREGRSATGGGFVAPARSRGVLGRGGAGQTVEFVKDPTRAANDGEGRIFGRVDGEAGPFRNGVREARQEGATADEPESVRPQGAGLVGRNGRRSRPGREA